jgi:manganese/iron transport system substrate-binding protein
MPSNTFRMAGFTLLNFSLLNLMLSVGGCTTQSPTAANMAAKPLVVATTSVVCDLTRQIAADTVDLKCLIAAGADPHGYEPKPDDRKAIEQAKLILYSGYNFESSLVKLIQATANPAPKVAVNEVAVPQPQLEPDPHVFHTAANGASIAEVIGTNLTQILPNNAAVYAANTKKVTAELAQLDAWIKVQIATIPAAQRQLVTTHDSFGYYSKAYGIPVIGALQGISSNERPTPARVKELVQAIKAAGVPTIFAEAAINPKLIEAVAQEARVKVADQKLFADGLGEPGSPADTYRTFLISNTKAIVEGLGGTYKPFLITK